MPYRLLLPATVDLLPADVHDALKPFGAQPFADRGCAWQLRGGGAPGVTDGASPIIVRLLPRKAIVAHPEEPRFRIPRGTQRALEVIVPADEPSEVDCQRVHDCATALAEALHLGVLNPYRGVYSPSVHAYRDGLTDPPATDALRVRAMSQQTQRPRHNRTRPEQHAPVRRAERRRVDTGPDAHAARQGALGKLVSRMRGTKQYEMRLPRGAGKGHAQTIIRRLKQCVPMAQVTLNARRRALLIDAPSSPLVHRTMCEFIDKYTGGATRALEATSAAG